MEATGMRHIRIGKDIRLQWAITTDGAAVPLEGRDLTLEMKSPIGKVIILPYRVDGNVLTMTYYGYAQTVVGEYSLTLWENKGKPGQNVVDAIRAFKLVRTSPEEEDFIGGDLQVESVDLGTANLEILSGGGAATPGESPDLSALEGKVAANTASISKINAELGNVKEVQEGQNNSIGQISTTIEEHANSIASNNTSCEENAAAIRNLKGDLSEGTATTSSVPLVMTNALGKTVTATLNQATNGRAGVMTVDQVNQLSDAKADAKEAIAALQNTPTVANSSVELDLDISDEQGNVLARFANGHIQVKNFNSAEPKDFDSLMFLSSVSACKYSGNLMHISFDDTSLCLNSLFGQSHESIYNVTFFSNLKTLHETYGACFSCYVYVESLANVNNNYATEFQSAKNWLKWNFHTLNDKKYKDGTSINDDYTLGISRLLTMVGGDKECLDHQMRGNYWELSLSNAKYVRDNTTHSSYIFCAKDPFSPSSGNYYLDDKQKAFVFNNGFLIDIKNRVLFIQTCARLDDNEKVLASKEYIANNPKWQKSCEVLNHEWAFDNNRMSAFLDWAKNTMGFRFGFFDNIYKF